MKTTGSSGLRELAEHGSRTLETFHAISVVQWEIVYLEYGETYQST